MPTTAPSIFVLTQFTSYRYRLPASTCTARRATKLSLPTSVIALHQRQAAIRYERDFQSIFRGGLKNTALITICRHSATSGVTSIEMAQLHFSIIDI